MLRRTTRKLLIYKERYKIIMFPAYEAVKKSKRPRKAARAIRTTTRLDAALLFRQKHYNYYLSIYCNLLILLKILRYVFPLFFALCYVTFFTHSPLIML